MKLKSSLATKVKTTQTIKIISAIIQMTNSKPWEQTQKTAHRCWLKYPPDIPKVEQNLQKITMHKENNV